MKKRTPVGSRKTLPSPPSLSRWVVYLAVGFVLAVLAVLVGHYLFKFATGTRFNTDQWSAAGAWVAGGGAIVLALVTVWQTHRANQQARDAEERARSDAAAARGQARRDAQDTRWRHWQEMAAAEQRHRNELNDANDRVARQIKYEWYREQARAVASIWDAVGRSMEPISRLAQVIEELIAIRGANPVTHPACHKARNAVSETYVVWRFQLMEVLTVITAAEMLVEERSTLAEQIDSLKGRIQRHMQDGMNFKNAAMDHGGGAGVSMFMKDINGFLELREPMTREVRKLLASTTNTPSLGTAGTVPTASSKSSVRPTDTHRSTA